MATFMGSWFSKEKREELRRLRREDVVRRKLFSKKMREREQFEKRMKSHKRRLLIRESVEQMTIGEWELLKTQHNYTCPSCKKKEPVIKLTIDHIIPVSKGGSNGIANIQPLCQSCNSRKHTKIIRF